MDLVQKYIEDKIEYEIDDWFYQQLSHYTVDEATLMVGQTLSVLSELPKEDAPMPGGDMGGMGGMGGMM